MKGKKLDHEPPNNPSIFKRNGEWKESGEWPTVRAVAVCEEPGCRFAGVEVPLNLPRNVDGRFRSSCGVCGADNALYTEDLNNAPGKGKVNSQQPS